MTNAAILRINNHRGVRETFKEKRVPLETKARSTSSNQRDRLHITRELADSLVSPFTKGCDSPSARTQGRQVCLIMVLVLFKGKICLSLSQPDFGEHAQTGRRLKSGGKFSFFWLRNTEIPTPGPRPPPPLLPPVTGPIGGRHLGLVPPNSLDRELTMGL